jgi:hypothetical protein
MLGKFCLSKKATNTSKEIVWCGEKDVEGAIPTSWMDVREARRLGIVLVGTRYQGG